MEESACKLCGGLYMSDENLISEAKDFCSDKCLGNWKILQSQMIDGTLEMKVEIAKTIKFFKTLPQDGDTDYVLATQFMQPLTWDSVHAVFEKVVGEVEVPDDFKFKGSKLEILVGELKNSMLQSKEAALVSLWATCEEINEINGTKEL